MGWTNLEQAMSEERKKILVVDDEPDVGIYLTSLLEDSGFEVLVAHGVKEGMELAKKEHLDLISLDITMPEETGIRMLHNLHDDADTENIPVVIVTGADLEFRKWVETQRQIETPAAYLEKPIDKGEYLTEIKRILGLS